MMIYIDLLLWFQSAKVRQWATAVFPFWGNLLFFFAFRRSRRFPFIIRYYVQIPHDGIQTCMADEKADLYDVHHLPSNRWPWHGKTDRRGRPPEPPGIFCGRLLHTLLSSFQAQALSTSHIFRLHGNRINMSPDLVMAHGTPLGKSGCVQQPLEEDRLSVFCCLCRTGSQKRELDNYLFFKLFLNPFLNAFFWNSWFKSLSVPPLHRLWAKGMKITCTGTNPTAMGSAERYYCSTGKIIAL